jgi:hypothetical protein
MLTMSLLFCMALIFFTIHVCAIFLESLLYNRELPTFPTKAQAVILDSTSIICSLATAPTYASNSGFTI